MRQLIIQVPRGNGKAVIDIAKSHNGSNLGQFAGNADEPIDVVMVHVSNREVGKVIEALQDLPKVHITLTPTGVMALQPPASEAPQQVVDVEERSPSEIFLSGLQSVGSWRGFLGYAALAGFVAQVQKTVEQVGLAKLVESNVRFTTANIPGQDTLLSVIYVQRQPQVTASNAEIRLRLTQAIQTQLLQQDFNVTPLVTVNVLEAPANKQ